MTRPFIKGKFANSGDLADVPATASVGNEFNYYDGIAPDTAKDKSEGGLPQDRQTLNSALQLLSKFAVGLQDGQFTLPTFDSRMTVAPMTGYSSDSVLYYNDVANSSWLILKSTKSNNTDDFTSDPSYIGTSWTQIGIIPYNLSVLATPALQTGQILFGLFKSLPSSSYIWGDNGRQQLNNASTNYSNLVDSIVGGILPYDTITAWDAAYAANPDNAVSFWGYDPDNDIVIAPNIPRGYTMTAAGLSTNLGTVLENAAPNITTDSGAGAEKLYTHTWSNGAVVCTQIGNHGLEGGNVIDVGRFTFDASRSNAAYGRDSTTRVRNDQVQMRVMFYIGAEINPEEANQITAAGVLSDVAALNGITGQGGATPMIDYIVEQATGLSGTNYTKGWYRKWKSGFVEQGAYINAVDTVILIVTMADVDNVLMANVQAIASSSTGRIIAVKDNSTVSKLNVLRNDTGFKWSYEIKGMAA